MIRMTTLVGHVEVNMMVVRHQGPLFVGNVSNRLAVATVAANVRNPVSHGSNPQQVLHAALAFALDEVLRTTHHPSGRPS